VSVRPGKPNGAASSFFSGMIREPLAGVRAQVPVPASTPVALSSPRSTIEGILRAAETSDADWGALNAMNLPALRTTVGEMAAALERVAGKTATGLLDWTEDPAILKLVKTWPGNVQAARATGLGLLPDADFESIVREYVRENPDAVVLPVHP
jgi:D-erythronate 2-dehydrogenase